MPIIGSGLSGILAGGRAPAATANAVSSAAYDGQYDGIRITFAAPIQIVNAYDDFIIIFASGTFPMLDCFAINDAEILATFGGTVNGQFRFYSSQQVAISSALPWSQELYTFEI